MPAMYLMLTGRSSDKYPDPTPAERCEMWLSLGYISTGWRDQTVNVPFEPAHHTPAQIVAHFTSGAVNSTAARGAMCALFVHGLDRGDYVVFRDTTHVYLGEVRKYYRAPAGHDADPYTHRRNLKNIRSVPRGDHPELETPTTTRRTIRPLKSGRDLIEAAFNL